jgi:hypothetical protein
MLLRRESVIEAIDICQASDFYVPFHARVFSAIEELLSEGTPIDFTTVGAKVGGDDVFSRLVSMTIDTPAANATTDYAKIVYDKSVARTILRDIEGAREKILSGADPYETTEELDRLLGTIGTAHLDEVEAVTLDELSESMSDVEDVVIPGMLNRGWRTIIVAPEGSGKSTVLRAIGISASQGLHPFSHRPINPVRVLVVDLENPKEAIVETGLKFMKFLRPWSQEDYDPTRFKVFRRPGGIDLRRAKDKADLRREIDAHKPDLVCIGPVIKMYQRKGGESYEESADAAMYELDQLRVRYGFALMLEHHAAKGHQGQRDMTPFGSQRWMSWPESGKSLTPDKDDPTLLRVSTFRGDRLAGIQWPNKILRDREWLVNGVWDDGVPESAGRRQ